MICVFVVIALALNLESGSAIKINSGGQSGSAIESGGSRRRSSTPLVTKERGHRDCPPGTVLTNHVYDNYPAESLSCEDPNDPCFDDTGVYGPHCVLVGVSSSGDPHMVNLRGERFDVHRSGHHTLLEIPQGALPGNVSLKVVAYVVHRPSCQAEYIKALNFTGKYVQEATRKSMIKIKADDTSRAPKWNEALHLGPIFMKVMGRATKKGYRYLNVQAKNLTGLQVPIGGILGMDDHADAEKSNCIPPPMNLVRAGGDVVELGTEVADGSFAFVS